MVKCVLLRYSMIEEYIRWGLWQSQQQKCGLFNTWGLQMMRTLTKSTAKMCTFRILATTVYKVVCSCFF